MSIGQVCPHENVTSNFPLLLWYPAWVLRINPIISQPALKILLFVRSSNVFWNLLIIRNDVGDKCLRISKVDGTGQKILRFTRKTDSVLPKSPFITLELLHLLYKETIFVYSRVCPEGQFLKTDCPYKPTFSKKLSLAKNSKLSL